MKRSRIIRVSGLLIILILVAAGIGIVLVRQSPPSEKFGDSRPHRKEILTSTVISGTKLTAPETQAILNRLDQRIDSFGDYVAVVTDTPMSRNMVPAPELSAVVIYAQRGGRSVYRRYLVGSERLRNGKKRMGTPMPLPVDWPRPNISQFLKNVAGISPVAFVASGPGYGYRALNSDEPLAKLAGERAGMLALEPPWQLPRSIWIGGRWMNGAFAGASNAYPEIVSYADPNSRTVTIVRRSPARTQEAASESIRIIDPEKDDLPLSENYRTFDADGRTAMQDSRREYLGFEVSKNGKFVPTHWRHEEWENGQRYEVHEYHLQIADEIELLISGWI